MTFYDPTLYGHDEEEEFGDSGAYTESLEEDFEEEEEEEEEAGVPEPALGEPVAPAPPPPPAPKAAAPAGGGGGGSKPAAKKKAAKKKVAKKPAPAKKPALRRAAGVKNRGSRAAVPLFSRSADRFTGSQQSVLGTSYFFPSTAALHFAYNSSK